MAAASVPFNTPATASWPPIQYPGNRKLAANVLQKQVDAITLRDMHSKTELEQLGVNRPRVQLSADPTVILPAAPPETLDAIMENMELDPKGA